MASRRLPVSVGSAYLTGILRSDRECLNTHDSVLKGLSIDKSDYKIHTQYLILDSFSKNPESKIDKGEFQWNIWSQGPTTDQAIGVITNLDRVIEIHVDSFIFPQPPDIEYTLSYGNIFNDVVFIRNNNIRLGPPTLTPNSANAGQYPPALLIEGETTITPWISNPYSQLPFGNRLTMQIKEAGVQSISDRGGVRHHFEFDVIYLGDTPYSNPRFLMANPVNNTFIFNDPLSDLHRLTIIFRNPDIPIKFLPDCIYDASLNIDKNFCITITAYNHNLNVGDRIFIDNVNTESIILDTYLRRSEGYLAANPITVSSESPTGSKILDNTFYTDPMIDLSNLNILPKFPSIITIRIAKRRLRIPIKVRRLMHK